jgi:CheY-like chemotaxis protein/predicted transcriptional regulator
MAESIGSFSFDVTKRILCTLYNEGSIKKTALATKTRLNYNVCLRYIKMLNVLGWVDVSSDVSITESGRNVMKRLLNQPGPSTENDLTYGNDQDSSYERDTNNISNQQELISTNKFDDISKDANIMIVDDEPDVLLTYESFLNYAGFKVDTFEESYEALKAFLSRPRFYDLVILDIRMENLNGLQLYQCMKAMKPTARIIFASALDAAKELTSVLPDINSHVIIKKPVDRENFIKAVKMALSA